MPRKIYDEVGTASDSLHYFWQHPTALVFWSPEEIHSLDQPQSILKHSRSEETNKSFSLLVGWPAMPSCRRFSWHTQPPGRWNWLILGTSRVFGFRAFSPLIKGIRHHMRIDKSLDLSRTFREIPLEGRAGN